MLGNSHPMCMRHHDVKDLQCCEGPYHPGGSKAGRSLSAVQGSVRFLFMPSLQSSGHIIVKVRVDRLTCALLVRQEAMCSALQFLPLEQERKCALGTHLG